MQAESRIDRQCPIGARYLQPPGACIARADDGCYTAEIPGAEFRAAVAPNANVKGHAIIFEVRNDTEQVVYFPAVPGRKTINFELHKEGTDATLTLLDTQFCPTSCPRSGPVSEIDCGAPIPHLVAVPSGQAVSFRWSGDVALPTARACNSGPVRHCLHERAAQAGIFVVTICAFSSMDGNDRDIDHVTEIARAKGKGPSTCAEKEFAYPATGPVAIDFDSQRS